jgi:ABC-type transporter lipoprotein component MlaA
MSDIMSKNPFEIRSEMLQLAKDYMDQQYYMNKEFAEKMFEAGKMQMEELQKMTKMYSMEELMEKAKEMYSFVSEKK